MWQLKIKLYRGEFIAVARHVRKKSMFDLSGGINLFTEEYQIKKMGK
jgi:hypothetical protein